MAPILWGQEGRVLQAHAWFVYLVMALLPFAEGLPWWSGLSLFLLHSLGSTVLIKVLVP